MKQTSHLLMLMLMLIFLACSIPSCSNHKQQEALSHAESLMEAHPDSALILLERIEKSELGSKEEQARYALLMSMALDKNYVDTTSFDVLQPAIDYYSNKGSACNKLRTYYYQGRIFQNKGEDDNALNSFLSAADLIPQCEDSLLIARVLVAQACTYYGLYEIKNYRDNYLEASKIYNTLNLKEREFDCLQQAINGSIILGNRSMSDSLIQECQREWSFDEAKVRILNEYRLSYALKYCTENEIKNLIESHNVDNLYESSNGELNLAFAYTKLGWIDRANRLLNDISQAGTAYDTLKYLSIHEAILEHLGNHEEALRAYKTFSHKLDSINAIKFEQKTKTVEEKHKVELQAQKEARLKDRIIWSCIAGIIILFLGLLLLLLIIRNNKTQKKLDTQKIKTAEAENESLKLIQERIALNNKRLSLENKNLQLEKEKKTLEAEVLSQRVEALETDRENLKSIIEDHDELPKEVQDAIQIRIEMLNSLLASYITSNEQFEKSYDLWVKELTDDTNTFMNSNRLAFTASHPRFIQYFEEHGLTTSEINYVCLYAIGLRGKEVGNYMKKRSHVNISSGIRKKLGIDKHETNIGIYVRKLLRDL